MRKYTLVKLYSMAQQHTDSYKTEMTNVIRSPKLWPRDLAWGQDGQLARFTSSPCRGAPEQGPLTPNPTI